ncbi:Wnt/PCP co-receptor [Aureococcus anophagefferens]|uniref:Wnt/PCP co-receptor n=1 Tax=Aureococcus anophagefferens TaxID=44056 RepID=A0ABR1GAG7_AURAN
MEGRSRDEQWLLDVVTRCGISAGRASDVALQGAQMLRRLNIKVPVGLFKKGECCRRAVALELASREAGGASLRRDALVTACSASSRQYEAVLRHAENALGLVGPASGARDRRRARRAGGGAADPAVAAREAGARPRAAARGAGNARGFAAREAVLARAARDEDAALRAETDDEEAPEAPAPAAVEEEVLDYAEAAAAVAGRRRDAATARRAAAAGGRRSSRLPKDKARVAFTCTDDDPVLESQARRAQQLSSAGLLVADSAADATVVVVGPRLQVKTSVAIAFARGVPIVTSDWLAHCASHGYEEPSAEFASKDAAFSRRYSVNLLDDGGRESLLRKYAVLVKPGYVLTDKPRYKVAAECAGAVWIAAAPRKPEGRALLIIDAACSFNDAHLHVQPKDFLLAILRNEDPAKRARHRIRSDEKRKQAS